MFVIMGIIHTAVLFDYVFEIDWHSITGLPIIGLNRPVFVLGRR